MEGTDGSPEQNELFNFKAGGTYEYHCSFNLHARQYRE
jgi:hypothetical protein